MGLTYSPEKRQFLTAVSPESLRDWALEIPIAKLNDIVKDLPSVKGGFRPGKDVPIRLLTFFSKLARWSEDDWTLLRRIWLLWTQNSPALEQGLGVTTSDELLELTQEMVEKPDVRRSAVMKLVTSSRGTSLNQDVIQTWYEKGPMPPDTEVRTIIGMAQTALEASLPVRLATLEQRAALFEKSFEDLVTELRAAVGVMRSLNKLVPIINSLESTSKVTDDRVNGITKRLSQMDESITRFTKTIESHDQALRKTRGEFSGLLTHMDSISVGLSDLRDRVDSLSRPTAESPTEESIDVPNLQFEELQREVVTLREELGQLTATSERNIPAPLEGHLRGPRPWVDYLSKADAIKLATVEEAAEHLAKNLNGLGVKLPQAQSLALDVIAALSSGQLVTFAGSMARLVAERCALSLAGDHANLVKIPVGLLDERSLDQYFESWSASAHSGNSPVGIIIDGANNSALEIFGPSLRRLVIDRLIGLGDHVRLFLFASLTDGSSTIPHGRDLLELGPLFDTDALGWLDSASRPVVPGSMLLDDWSNPVSDKKLDWDESWIPQWFLDRAGVVWRRAVGKAALFRRAIHPTGEHEIPTELAFGWVLPMALLLVPQEVGAIIKNISLDIRGKLLLVNHGVDVDSE